MIKTVIIEDDRMVASINNQFAEKTSGVQVVATFYNGRNAMNYLESSDADLLLLDLYMPGFSGLELLQELRRQGRNIEVIMITAANDLPHIKQALALGAADYLIKPFSYERFEEAMDKVLLRLKVQESGLEFTQEDIDRMLTAAKPNPKSKELELEKGMQRQTLEKLRACMHQFRKKYLTAEQISMISGLSKITVRRYMNYLIENGEAESRVDYSTGGRPRVEYQGK